MKPVDILPAARHDFDDSFDWYAERSATVAERFSHAVDETLKRIASAPEQFALVDGRHRECLVKRFPFRIVYRDDSDRVLVVAVAHAKRRPGFWRHRP
jgi:plasmid stabilization system protein ParE